MEEKKSLNNKYQKIDIDETSVEEQQSGKEKPVKGEKAKAQKEPKAKKEKMPKEPKAKKEKTPKEPKKPKEKPIKEPKQPKVKKEKKRKAKAERVQDFSAKISDEEAIVSEKSAVQEFQRETFADRRVSEEFVLPTVKSVEQISKEPKKDKKEKKVKEKKEKSPKLPKEKKEKEGTVQAAKEPKPPKEKKVKEKKTKEPKEKKPREPLTKKDFVTIAIAVLALAMVVVFAVVKYMPESDIETDFSETTTKSQDKLSSIQVVRDGISLNLIQSDIPDVFYGFSSDYKLKYYQYRDDKMVAVQSTGSVSAEVDMGNETIPVTIDYVELGGKIFGIGLFVANKTDDVYFYDMVAFQLVNLPEGYEQEGKALLLATTNKNVLTQRITMWPESFVVDLKSGSTTRFLKVINRNIDVSTGAGVDDFCILTKEGYSASNSIPFISAREYEAGSGQQDIFIKNGNKESLYASDVYGKFLLTDGNSVIFMRKTAKGFDVIRKTGEEEKVSASFYGTMGANYIYSGDYIFNKNDGKLYNLITGETKTVVGYRMSPEMISVSPDGKYLVMLGTVTNMMDYQVHIFNLENGDYTKFQDENYSSHSNLTFINNTTAVYMVLDPNQGYEYVVLDVTKTK